MENPNRDHWININLYLYTSIGNNNYITIAINENETKSFKYMGLLTQEARGVENPKYSSAYTFMMFEAG